MGGDQSVLQRTMLRESSQVLINADDSCFLLADEAILPVLAGHGSGSFSLPCGLSTGC
jgi:hypothetical protein